MLDDHPLFRDSATSETPSLKVPRDTIFDLTSDEYESYTRHGTYLALRDFYPRVLIAEYVARENNGERFSVDYGDFAGWLVKTGYVKDVSVTQPELHFNWVPACYTPEGSPDEIEIEVTYES
jgi:hypothetical protein